MLSLFFNHVYHADIKTSVGRTAADWAVQCGHYALADYVEAFRPGPRGELTISISSEFHS